MRGISPLSWSIFLWSYCCHAGGLLLFVFSTCGLDGSILLVIIRAAVYCFWLMVVRSMPSCDISSITLSSVHYVKEKGTVYFLDFSN